MEGINGKVAHGQAYSDRNILSVRIYMIDIMNFCLLELFEITLYL